MKRLAIILVNYNQPQHTVECINSVRESNYDDYDIIVIDNNSSDNSVFILQSIKDVILICAEENNGFAAGNNIGIKYAMKMGYESVMLLNNDTVIDKNMLSIMMNNYSVDKVITPQIMYYDYPDKVWYAGGHINFVKAKAVHDNMNKTERVEKEHSISFVTGCCVLLPINIIKMVGLLNERFFMYWEDVDYSLRLIRKKIPMEYIPEAKIWHKVGMSTKNNSYLNTYYDNRNRLIVMKEYHFCFVSYIYYFVSRFIRIIQGFALRNELSKYILRAIHDYYLGIDGKVDL